MQVEVISVDPDRKRIGLSMKRLERDPWDAVAIDFEVGQLVRGRVTKLTKFGAFARLVDHPEIEGLIHISELSDTHVRRTEDVVEMGDEVVVKCISVDRDGKIRLSRKDALDADPAEVNHFVV